MGTGVGLVEEPEPLIDLNKEFGKPALVTDFEDDFAGDFEEDFEIVLGAGMGTGTPVQAAETFDLFNNPLETNSQSCNLLVQVQ